LGRRKRLNHVPCARAGLVLVRDELTWIEKGGEATDTCKRPRQVSVFDIRTRTCEDDRRVGDGGSHVLEDARLPVGGTQRQVECDERTGRVDLIVDVCPARDGRPYDRSGRSGGSGRSGRSCTAGTRRSRTASTRGARVARRAEAGWPGS